MQHPDAAALSRHVLNMASRDSTRAHPGHAWAGRAWELLLTDRARPLRFAITGGLGALLQLGLLAVLTRHG